MGHTVENMFHCSFLISKEDFGLRMDDTCIPWLFLPDRKREPCKSMKTMDERMNPRLEHVESDDDTAEFESSVEKRAKHSNSRQYVPVQAIFNLNLKEWTSLVRVLKLENVKNLLP